METIKSALIAWSAEVEEEMIRLIKLGVPPWDAAVQARHRVERRRRDAAPERSK